ncbi:MAG TPA: T9SS type A sorting domain-containing protein, partial [Bacteroidia bacterium]|nr:T9SS type A sorting domain-containing protein [Bacteroidia bacterium]
VYYKNKKLSAWVNYSQGLPTICNVNDFMMYHDGGYTNSVLRVAYYGRGVWETPLYNPVTGINDLAKETPDFQIYPNPSAGNFTIQTKEYQRIGIYTVTGELINELKLVQETTEVNLSQQAKGLYIIKATAANGATVSKKITIQ